MAQAQQILENILPRIAREQNFVNYDVNIKPIDTEGENFTTTLFNITISEGDNVVHMFAKVAAMGEEMRLVLPKVFETEIFAYTKLVKVYEKLQDEHKVPQEHRLTFSKLYGYSLTKYEEIIVLEDLVKNGYQAYHRLNCIDWEYASASVRELAKWHALAFAYSEYYSEEFNEVAELAANSHWVHNDGDGYINLCESVIKRAIETVRKEHKDKLEKFFETFDIREFVDYYKTSGRNVIGHGDFKMCNIMYKKREDGTTDVRIIDLQLLHGGSPVIDLLFFIFLGSNEKFRAQHYDKLVDLYYNQLQAAMKRLHLDPEKVYSRTDFENDLKLKFSFGLIIAVLMLPALTVETQNAQKVNEDLGLSTFDVENPSDLYSERLNGIVNDYVKWGILK